MREDRHLIRRLRRGDPNALRRIYEKYKADLLAVACCLTVDLATAEDCVQDVFVSLAAGAAELRVRSSLKGYLITCVANRGRDLLRTRARRGSPVNIDEILDIAICEADSAAQQVMDREETASLYRAMAVLPYDQREVVTLHLRGELTFREIAERQGMSINTIQSRYRYGIEKLRTVLGAKGRT